MSTEDSSLRLPPPEPFSFTKPEAWLQWKRRFDRYRIASGLENKSGKEQVNALIYIMGNQSEDVFQSFQLSAEDSVSYKVVLDKFEAHFVPRRNIVFERARFNKRSQEETESMEEFITIL